MEYDIYKITEKHITGCPEDDSESSSYKSRIALVAEDKRDEFGESIADDCGNQDYAYQVSYNKIATLTDDELKLLGMEIFKEF